MVIVLEVCIVYFFHEYAQQQANSHFDDYIYGSLIGLYVIPITVIYAIKCYMDKKLSAFKFWLMLSIVVWCCCMFKAGDVCCHACTYGG